MSTTAPPQLSGRFDDALGLAREIHGGARRSGTGIPFMAHLLVVTGLVLEDGGDEDEAVAAMLHDAVEEAGGRVMLDRIERTFGERVAEIVGRALGQPRRRRLDVGRAQAPVPVPPPERR